MALFNAPFPQQGHELLAVKVAIEMQQRHKDLMTEWTEKGVMATPIVSGYYFRHTKT